MPLDEGVVRGTDHWREREGVSFCHWDRWLLRLSLDEPEGLHSIAQEFRRRARRPHGADRGAEAMLAQIADLETRIAGLGITTDSLLDEVEKASTWLGKKAFRRVWHGTSIECTEAMRRTPRAVLSARALSGNWSAFPVSPEPYRAELQDVVGHRWYDYRGTGVLVTLLSFAGERLIDAAAMDDARLAVHRAMLTVCIVAMEQVDDSLGELGDHFQEHECAYLELMRGRSELPGVLRDLLELVVWEDYGLFHAAERFLATLPQPAADVAVRDLARIIEELRNAGLDYQLRKALALRRTVLGACVLDGSDAG